MLSIIPTTSALETFKLWRLSGWPMGYPTDASPSPSGAARLGADVDRYSSS
jgi:hypothetical protein